MNKLKTVFVWFLISCLVMISTACHSKNEQTTLTTRQAAQVVTEQALIVATPTATVYQGTETAIVTQAVGTIVLVTEEAATPTGEFVSTTPATAVATTQANEGSGESLAERFTAIQLDENGLAEITITEAEMNEAMSQAQTVAAQTGQPVRLQDPTIHFTGGNGILSGTVPDRGLMEVIFQPTVVNGVLQFEAVSVTIGGARVPPPVLASAEQMLNDVLGQTFGQLPPGTGLQSVVVGEGFMTLVVGAV